ncbi:MAG: urease accessory protein UreE [Rhodospirillales bacterium]|jgi:urease accessory protein
MLIANRHAPAGHWPGQAAADILLDFDERHRRRIRLRANNGEYVLLDLPKAVAMANGDGVCTHDGRWFKIVAKPEALIEVTAADGLTLMQLAWHLGNRHTPAEVQEERILIRPDHVLVDMVRGLGGNAKTVEEPFQPEGGAYGGHGHAHSHDDHHSHQHGHTHEHRHGDHHSHD